MNYELKEIILIYKKSFDFSVRIVNLYRYLCSEYKEFVLSKQVLRSGTSIGANVNEASAAVSRREFISKMGIASKEARETKYWIELLVATEFLDEDTEYVRSLLKDIDEISKILTSIVKTTKENS